MYALKHDNFIDKIRRELQEVVKEYVKSGDIYDGNIQLYKMGDTWYLKFMAKGTSGEATYETPLCKDPDIEIYRNKYQLEELKGYCAKIFEVLSDLVNESY